MGTPDIEGQVPPRDAQLVDDVAVREGKLDPETVAAKGLAPASRPDHPWVEDTMSPQAATGATVAAPGAGATDCPCFLQKAGLSPRVGGADKPGGVSPGVLAGLWLYIAQGSARRRSEPRSAPTLPGSWLVTSTGHEPADATLNIAAWQGGLRPP